MATKKKRSTASAKSRATRGSITFKLTADEIKKAQACLERAGSIRYTFKNIKVTKLPAVLDDGKSID